LKRLADGGYRVSAAVSVTRASLPELPDLAEHLVESGAQALQVRPVAQAGRAQQLDGDNLLRRGDRARLYLVAQALQHELGARARVHCDLAPARALWAQRDDYAGLLGSCATRRDGELPLAELVNPIVITDSGALRPIAYDFGSQFDIAAVEGLSHEALQAFKTRGLADLRTLIGGALRGLQHSPDFVDWFDLLARLSSAPRAAERAGAALV
jgi:hypothetical protein